ncbi:TPA: phage tail tape measure protein, partial [Escherichia coli]|nr:phage tail tape measure protein [Escherichia coli]
KERARLINSKYKAEHESEIAAQEIIEEIAFSNERIEQQKTLTEDIKERSKASSVIIKAMYEKSEKMKIELETSIKEKQATEIKLSREAMSREREKMSYDKLKYQIEEKKKISQLSSAFYLINKLDLILTADSIKISLSGLGAVIASVFGYTSFTKLLEDENFNTDSLEAI